MGRVRFHDSCTAKWQLMHDLAPHLVPQESSPELFVHESGANNNLFLSEQRYPPNFTFGIHCHGSDEINYILGGEVICGGRVLRAGASMYVAAHTLYQFKAGPAGVHFLQFKASGDLSFFTMDQFKELRKARVAKG